MAKTGALNHWGLEAGTHTKLLGIDGDEEINRRGTNDRKLIPGFGHADEGDANDNGDHENFRVHKVLRLLIDSLADALFNQCGV